jgi:hypothetical protein
VPGRAGAGRHENDELCGEAAAPGERAMLGTRVEGGAVCPARCFGRAGEDFATADGGRSLRMSSPWLGTHPAIWRARGGEELSVLLNIIIIIIMILIGVVSAP